MAQLSKSGLKELLKECLIEIFTEEEEILESISNKVKKVVVPKTIAAPLKEEKQQKSSKGSSRKVAQDLVDRSMSGVNEQSLIENPALTEAVNSVTHELTMHDKSKSGIMKDILTDTAATTLQIQENGEMPVTKEQEEIDSASLEVLSEQGNISRWADVAFAKKD